MGLGINRNDGWLEEWDTEYFVEQAKVREKEHLAYLKTLTPVQLEEYKKLQQESWKVVKGFPRKYK